MRRRALGVLLVSGLLVASMLYVYFVVLHEGLAGLLVLGMIALLFGALVWFGRRSERSHRAVNLFFAAWIGGSLWMLLALAPIVGVLWLQQSVLPRLAFPLQLSVLVVWGILLTGGLLVIWTDARRSQLFQRLSRVGSFTPVAYSVNILLIAMLFFSSVTFLLVERDLLEFSASVGGDPVDVSSILGFYLWSFLDAIPVLEVTSTLRWEAPLSYQGGRVGGLVLLFKVVVILPVIAAFSTYPAFRRERRQQARQAAGVPAAAPTS